MAGFNKLYFNIDRDFKSKNLQYILKPTKLFVMIVFFKVVFTMIKDKFKNNEQT
jgi:hypothetical protein